MLRNGILKWYFKMESRLIGRLFVHRDDAEKKLILIKTDIDKNGYW